jgi:hypothetical protein
MKRTYVWPYQMHASIGPSCSVADVQGDFVRVVRHANPHILRTDLALLLSLPETAIDVVGWKPLAATAATAQTTFLPTRAAVARGGRAGAGAIDPRTGA